jgi:hypothetical protein
VKATIGWPYQLLARRWGRKPSREDSGKQSWKMIHGRPHDQRMAADHDDRDTGQGPADGRDNG